MRDVCLISVPHTGTNFVREIFVSQGWTDIALGGRTADTPKFYQGHCEKLSQCLSALELGERMPIIMPLRHPYRVEESWRRRGEDTRRMLSAYHNMLFRLRECVDVWVPIDADNHIRQAAREQLNEVAGKRLSIVWDRPVNSVHNTHDIDLSVLDPSQHVRDIFKCRPFPTFYGEEVCDAACA